jgi:general secretion pathway protein C
MIRLSTLAIWLAAVAGAVFWGLKFMPSPTAPANTAVVGGQTTLPADSSALARGLGGGLAPLVASAEPQAPVVSTIDAARFVLTGIVTGPSSRQNLALIAMDGKPARPYRVGAQLTDGVVLASVNRYEVTLAPSRGAPAGATLQLAKLFASAGAAAQPGYYPPPQLPNIPPPMQPLLAAPVAEPPPPQASEAQPSPSAPTGRGLARIGANFAPADPAGVAKSGQQEAPSSAPVTTQ